MTHRLNLLLVVGVCLVGTNLHAAKRRALPEGDQVELFAAMQDGQLEVQFIPKDATQAMVMLKNKTKRPLNIKLPEAFAAVPVAAQIGGRGGGLGGGGLGGGGLGGGGLGGGGGTQQAMGGGMGGMGGGGMGGMGGGGMGGMGGGMFNVKAERVGKFKVATVCLEHGKPDPNPRIPYTLKPIKEFTNDAKVIEVCKMLGYGSVDQLSAQAAAWNLTDGLAWNELAHKVKVKHLNGQIELYFSRQHVQRAIQIVVEASRRAEKVEATTESQGEILDRQS